jgi:hypothetical protein
VTTPRLACAKCGAPLDPPSGPGRPAAYCSDLCKRLTEYEVRRLDRRLSKYELELREQKARGVQFDDEEEHERQRRLRALRAWIRTDEARLRELLSAAGADRGNQKEST